MYNVHIILNLEIFDMKKIYFVRHGQSKWNVEDKICGATDIELTDEGHNQAIVTGNLIKDNNIMADMILCSPLKRAADTAKHISEITGIPYMVDDRLIEQNFGKFEGSSPRNSEIFFEAKKQFLNRYEGGESMFQVAHRIYSLLDELKQDDKTYILVAHNGIARIVNSYFYEMTNDAFAAYGVPNCKLIEFEIF